MPASAKPRRVLVVGWDGATFDVADPMIAAGKLPNLAKLMERGTRCKLRSTVPPNSSIAWSSFATGKQAGKHGVYYFVERTPGSYERRLINAASLKTETLWSLLSRHEKTIGVLNVPVTFPPRPVRGTLVAGMLSPSPESSFTWPPSLHTELMANVGWVPLDHVEGGVAYSPERMRLLNEIWRAQERRSEVAQYLMDRDPWQFFMVVFTSSDRIGHVSFRFQDEAFQSAAPELVAKYGNILQDTYAQLDRLTGELLAKVDEDTTVILLSDHGMGPLRKRFRLSRWLIEQGYLVLKPNAERKRLGWEIRRRRLGRLRIPSPGRYPIPPWELVDWSRSKAYPAWGGGEEVVLINLAGREPQGIVQDGPEYEALCDEICQALESFTDPETGGHIIPAAHKRADLWHGHAVELAPDIQFEVEDVAYHIDCGLFETEVLHDPIDKVPGMHRMDGICILAGPGIEAGHSAERNELIDVAPTVCHLLDVPVPEDMDGKVMTNTFSATFQEEHPVRFGPPTLEADPGGGQELSAEETDAVEETLRAMGYVS